MQTRFVPPRLWQTETIRSNGKPCFYWYHVKSLNTFLEGLHKIWGVWYDALFIWALIRAIIYVDWYRPLNINAHLRLICMKLFNNI